MQFCKKTSGHGKTSMMKRRRACCGGEWPAMVFFGGAMQQNLRNQLGWLKQSRYSNSFIFYFDRRLFSISRILSFVFAVFWTKMDFFVVHLELLPGRRSFWRIFAWPVSWLCSRGGGAWVIQSYIIIHVHIFQYLFRHFPLTRTRKNMSVLVCLKIRGPTNH